MLVEAPHNQNAALANKPAYDLRQIDCDPNFWYPVAWSHKVRKGKAFAARYAGHPIALIRPEKGPVYALEDRCAHRQVPLSKGLVEGDCIKCCYHGWAFDRAGKCVTVPYLNREDVGRPVKAYPCREKAGLIFIFPGDPALAESVPLPAVAQVGNPDYKTRLFSPRLKCHYSFMHENLMDMNHQFLHRRQMGSITARFLGQDKGENFLEARYSFARKGGNQPLAEALIFGKHHDLEGREQPVEEVVSIRTTYPYQTLKIHDKDGDLIMDLWVCYVPLGADQLGTQTFGLLSVKKPKWGFLLDLAWPALGIFTHRIFEEDREIVEMEQKAWRELGGDHNIEVFPIVKSLRALLAREGVPNRAAKPVSKG
ncbi:aromatic ring-hydroxylating dioxygenase subunit alpha [Acetobacter orientalis]|uniref:aromatic ring-hydroxylating oxygenase subunit alpha n=1 Tax=Acetobacter orientalis TaxID=146474 RepID=UPI00209C8EFC|nr:aromatic ring-hydroxylating dioxygenase subunit alpha [Acetobacter orientalis]MCP1215873.1 aromatic ring-hydroxylating dioxygenase subunit alpha [Acetobacter orientalis]MCP1217967.1 aromatic ring-hydroxylating dioxygenase subunit alpha [Acetobacter orientalis]